MPPAQANILHLVLSFHAGGRKNAIKTLARGLRGSVDCHLCCLDELGCDPDEPAELFQSVNELGRGPLGYLAVVRRLRALCRLRRIALIHAHDAASQFVASLVRLTRPGLKVVMTFHRSLGFESARRRDRLRNAFACWLSEAVVTGSAERRDHFLAENYVAQRKLSVIPFGVDTTTFRPDPAARAEIRSRLGIPEGCVAVGVVGHFGHEKGVDLAVAAFGEACRRTPDRDSVLVLLGDGTPERRDAIHRAVGGLPAGRVVVAGFQKNVCEWYPAFDALLHAPRQEAFGLVVVEAMAAGLPVVATRVGGIPEIVRDGKTGLLAAPESVDELAGALARLIQASDLRSRLAANAREVALGEYSADRYAARHLELYGRVLSPAARALAEDGAARPDSLSRGPSRV